MSIKLSEETKAYWAEIDRIEELSTWAPRTHMVWIDSKLPTISPRRTKKRKAKALRRRIGQLNAEMGKIDTSRLVTINSKEVL